MKCQKCGGKGYIYTNAFGTNGKLRCDVCGGNGEILSNHQTNEKWLHTLPMEEMADEIIGHIAHEIGLARYYNDDDVKEFVEWLKQPHREEIHK